MRAIDADGLLRELTALSHGQVWPGWTYEGIRLLIERQPPLTPPNEPLTLEQLREMDGEPVWIANPDALEYGRWGIVDGVYQAEDDQVLMLRGDYSCHYYGKTWLAYRRPPEGGNHHG